MKVIQQGDVLIKEINTLPVNLKPRKNMIIAYGESTGHKHELRLLDRTDIAELVDQNQDVLYEDEQGNLYIKNATPVEIHHNTHKTLTIDPGLYKIDFVLEKNHPQQEARRVSD